MWHLSNFWFKVVSESVYTWLIWASLTAVVVFETSLPVKLNLIVISRCEASLSPSTATS